MYYIVLFWIYLTFIVTAWSTHQHQDLQNKPLPWNEKNFNDKKLTPRGLQSAILKFQKTHFLLPGGKPSEDILDALKTPRCGLHRVTPASNGKWEKFHLNWCLKIPSKKIPVCEQRKMLKFAFRVWSQDSKFRFSEVSCNDADIRLSFTWNHPHNKDNFDGQGSRQVYVHVNRRNVAGFKDVDIYFDEAENWQTHDTQEASLFFAAAHAIGHSLGLGHSTDPRSVMVFRFDYPVGRLSSSDKKALQHLYGESVVVKLPGPSMAEKELEEKNEKNNKNNKVSFLKSKLEPKMVIPEEQHKEFDPTLTATTSSKNLEVDTISTILPTNIVIKPKVLMVSEKSKDSTRMLPRSKNAGLEKSKTISPTFGTDTEEFLQELVKKERSKIFSVEYSSRNPETTTSTMDLPKPTDNETVDNNSTTTKNGVTENWLTSTQRNRSILNKVLMELTNSLTYSKFSSTFETLSRTTSPKYGTNTEEFLQEQEIEEKSKNYSDENSSTSPETTSPEFKIPRSTDNGTKVSTVDYDSIPTTNGVTENWLTSTQRNWSILDKVPFESTNSLTSSKIFNPKSSSFFEILPKTTSPIYENDTEEFLQELEMEEKSKNHSDENSSINPETTTPEFKIPKSTDNGTNISTVDYDSIPTTNGVTENWLTSTQRNWSILDKVPFESTNSLTHSKTLNSLLSSTFEILSKTTTPKYGTDTEEFLRELKTKKKSKNYSDVNSSANLETTTPELQIPKPTDNEIKCTPLDNDCITTKNGVTETSLTSIQRNLSILDKVPIETTNYLTSSKMLNPQLSSTFEIISKTTSPKYETETEEFLQEQELEEKLKNYSDENSSMNPETTTPVMKIPRTTDNGRKSTNSLTSFKILNPQSSSFFEILSKTTSPKYETDTEEFSHKLEMEEKSKKYSHANSSTTPIIEILKSTDNGTNSTTTKNGATGTWLSSTQRNRSILEKVPIESTNSSKYPKTLNPQLLTKLGKRSERNSSKNWSGIFKEEIKVKMPELIADNLTFSQNNETIFLSSNLTEESIITTDLIPKDNSTEVDENGKISANGTCKCTKRIVNCESIFCQFLVKVWEIICCFYAKICIFVMMNIHV